MKKFILFKCVLSVCIISLAFPNTSFSHSGRTDKYGCHQGEAAYRHCHNDDDDTNWGAVLGAVVILGGLYYYHAKRKQKRNSFAATQTKPFSFAPMMSYDDGKTAFGYSLTYRF
ncbi:LPXTG cell wall anchor domain-containing protein [Candidatus Spongiihabitans sp.]|uniref:LPXTG cell wall anchor domain-containing protein n=1 Tax=Candidatus Spongiihabitans sp. TaxID=3101308 RepID=UPI003C7BB277